ncbi:MAG: hypothetical protein ACI8Y7_000643 [Candidatus Woesearchaeota archaeon]|jgi:hypothetical protein
MKHDYETLQEDFYTESSMDQMLDDDEINSSEQGFMLGYMEA